MKLRETSFEMIIKNNLVWDDFDEKNDIGNGIYDALADDSEKVLKIGYLNHQQNGDLLDKVTFHKVDFYEVDFTEYARFSIAKGLYSPEKCSRGIEIDYQKDYSGLKLLIEDMGDVAALYLKDYDFGYVKPLGMCIYESNGLCEDASSREEFLSDIEIEVWEGGVDLEQEFYNYYHNIPDIGSAFIESQIDLKALLTVKDAANRLGVSDARVKRMIADKQLDGYKFGNKLLVAESSVNRRIAYIKEHGKPTRGKGNSR